MTATTRDRLHEEIWAEPMTRVADRYGISDVGLKKICIKHRIPTPPRGYWARLKAGKKDKKKIFRQVSDPRLNRIEICGLRSGLSPEEINEREAGAKMRKETVEQAALKVASASSDDRHPIAERFHARMSKRKADSGGFIANRIKSCIRVEIAPLNVDRMTNFLSVFIRTLEAAGHSLERSDNGLLFRCDGEDLSFELTEKTDRRPHLLTPKEETGLEKYKEYLIRRARHTGYDDWDWRDYVSEPRIVEFDYIPNGRLVFRFTDGGYDGLRRTFADGKTQTIEKLLPDILAGASSLAEQKKKDREEKRIRKLEREEKEKIALARRRQQNLERLRAESMDELMGKWRNAAGICEFIEAVQARVARSNKPGIADEWIEWASKYADALDPLTDSIPKLARMEDFPSWELDQCRI